MHSFELRLDPSPRRSLENLPLGVAAAIAEFMLGPLCANPQRVGKALQRELAGCRSARIREYRIVYRVLIDDHVVHVLRIDHRSDVYRKR